MSKKPALTDALQASVTKESAAVADRFAKADAVLLSGSTRLERAGLAGQHRRPTPAAATSGYQSEVVRDTFSIPVAEYAVIQELRQAAARQGRICTKSEIVRAGLRSLADLPAEAFGRVLDAIERIKPGRKSG